MNAYFQLIEADHGVDLRLVPPTNGGSPIDINELNAYLQLKHVPDIDMKLAYAALRQLDSEKIVQISASKGYTEQEMVLLRVSEDKMSAVGRFYPPSTYGARMSKEEIIQDMKYRNIRFGIDEQAIEAFVANPQYCTDIVLAKGVAPRHGKDAEIEYFFNTELNTRPARNEDGSVDFFHLNTINHCKEGEVLARLIREDRGEPGNNVVGEVIKPRDVKHKTLRFGRNITLTEDGLNLISQINGHVSLVGDKVFVSDVYEVENVGPTTGNIEAEGSVVVSGNVQAGYQIKAKGNVEVSGIVEGATIEAGGNIILTRGMNGMNKGVLKAGGSVISKFFENSTIESGSFVEADSILHSNVVAKTEIMVDGKKGFIAGGSVRATNKIVCRTLGSSMGADTYVEVGVDPKQKIRYQALQKEMVEIQRNLKSVQPILLNLTQKLQSGVKLTPEQVKYLKSLAEINTQQTEKMEACQREFDEIGSMLSGQHNAYVAVREEAYAGTKVAIMDASVILKKSVSFCRFIYEKGDVKTTSY